MSEELKVCPFCNNPFRQGSQEFEIKSFICEECGYEIDIVATLDEAIEEMNRRPGEKEVQSRLNQQTIELYKALDERDALRKQLDYVRLRIKDVIDDKLYWEEETVKLCQEILAEIEKVKNG
jgi:hypothetical protein